MTKPNLTADLIAEVFAINGELITSDRDHIIVIDHQGRGELRVTLYGRWDEDTEVAEGTFDLVPRVDR